jgi:NodT family efflux transporter outer membrane factor (OMF) lipoprotein
VSRRATLVTALLLPAILLAACTPGAPRPTTQLPLPSQPGGNGPTAPINPASGPAQSFTMAQVSTAWWMMFGNDTLTSLVDRAIAANNDIATADAALKQAHEQALVAGAAQLPTIDANYQANRARIAQEIATPLADPNATNYTLHTAQLTVGYTLDVFGGVRDRIVSARAAADVARYRFQAARTTVIANLVLAVIQNASLTAQIAAADTNIAANKQVLAMLQVRQQLGAVGTLDLSIQETALATAEAVRPPLIRAQMHTQAQIAALIGLAPGQPLPALPRLDQLMLAAQLPIALPSELVAHRPDVRAARAQMEGAAADVGTAIAARLPLFQLSAMVGGSATDFTQMFSSGNLFWNLVGGVTQPLFHGGALAHQQHAAEAAFAGTQAQYRATALQAFVDVSDALTALKTDADLLDANTRAQSAASRTLGYVSRQLQLGDVGTFALLNSEAANAQASSALIQARASRLTDCVALIQALGGGWDDGSKLAATAAP